MKEPIITFNGGELTPLVDARSDINKYSAGCRLCVHMLPLIYGAAQRRPGFEFINGSYDNTVVGRVIPFIYSNEIAYVIEMSNLINRYYYDGGIVIDDDGNDVTTVTPYSGDDLFQIQYAQSNDVMRLVHGDYAPRILSRVTASEFTLEEIDFKNGPFLLRNDWVEDNDITLSSSVIVKDEVGTLTAVGPMSPVEVFESGHVGSLWMLTMPRANTNIHGTATGTGVIDAAIDVDGPFTFKTAGHWHATVRLQRNESENGWEDYRIWHSRMSAGVGSLNAQYTGIEYAPNVQFRINVTQYTAGTVEASLTVNTSTQSGIVKVQSVEATDSATIKVISKLATADTATKQWNEGAWSGVRGYPKTVAFYNSRCIYAGTAYQPQTIWLSEINNYNMIQ